MRSVDVCRHAEITYRQLDYWTSAGYLTPYGNEKAVNPGQGTAREYSLQQADKARMMRCLQVLGFEVHLAEKIAAFAILGEYKLHLGHGVTIQIDRHAHTER